jgi:hypothetical protein
VSLEASAALAQHLSNTLSALAQMLPAGCAASRALNLSLTTLKGLETLSAERELAPLKEALLAWRNRVAPLCPAEFTLHIDVDPSAERALVDQRVIEALHVTTVALLEADEVEWLSLSFAQREGHLTMTSDPHLARYINKRDPLHLTALSLLPREG